MTSLAGQFIVALVLVLAGGGLWTAAKLDTNVAGAAGDLAGLQYDKAAALDGAEAGNGLLRWLPGVEGAAERAQVIGDTARYWQGTTPAGGKASASLLSANAAYHAAMDKGGKWPEVVAKLDEVVKQYATVVRDEPDNVDAAFNYEFVVRLRSALAAARRDVPADLLESHVTLHGVAGAPPQGTDTKTFKMIVPMQPDERREAETAGRGAPRNRKG